jgi:hypothetical protein
MFDPQPLVPDAVRLQQEIARTQRRGRLIADRTARELARWFAEASGPGLRTFLATGRVTRQLHAELTRLHDLRSDEAGHWLATLTRFVLSRPLDPQSRRRARQIAPEDAR